MGKTRSTVFCINNTRIINNDTKINWGLHTHNSKPTLPTPVYSIYLLCIRHVFPPNCKLLQAQTSSVLPLLSPQCWEFIRDLKNACWFIIEDVTANILPARDAQPTFSFVRTESVVTGTNRVGNYKRGETFGLFF